MKEVMSLWLGLMGWMNVGSYRGKVLIFGDLYLGSHWLMPDGNFYRLIFVVHVAVHISLSIENLRK